MGEPQTTLSREEVARIELGRTAISRRTAHLLVGVFLLTVFGVPAAQHVADIRSYVRGERPRVLPDAYDVFTLLPHAARRGARQGAAQQAAAGAGPFRRVVMANTAVLGAMDRYERGLEDAFVLRPVLLPRVQLGLVKWLGWSNEQAYLGRDGWLFYRPGMDHVTGPGFLSRRHINKRLADRKEWQPARYVDPVAAIVGFAGQLKQRGIQLIVVPTPSKASVHPEQFSPRYADAAAALENPSFARFKAELERGGVRVFDCAGALVEAKRRTGEPQYLETDTHWTPGAMERTAARLSDFIGRRVTLPPVPSPGYVRREAAVTNLGDVAVMLNLPAEQGVFQPQTALIHPVGRGTRYLWRPDREADVLVLGDSFANVFSLPSMAWGESAGLVEQLSLRMQRPLDRIVRNADGAFATREMLGRELARGRDRLAGKRLVIWQFAARELSVGNWKPVDLVLGELAPGRFVVPESGETMRVSGTVADAAPAPRPGTVPYKDHIIAVHLVDLTDEAGNAIAGGQAVVYTWSMRDGVWTRAARLRWGQAITARLRRWADVSGQLEGINRAEPDGALQLEEPCWAEEVAE